MKTIKSQCGIKFTYVDLFAHNISEDAKAMADVEGKLLIFFDGKLFFSEEILLLELALMLHTWLKNVDRDTSKNFYYESMDYEDKPILEFTEQKGEWRIYSVWQKFSCTKRIEFTELEKL